MAASAILMGDLSLHLVWDPFRKRGRGTKRPRETWDFDFDDVESGGADALMDGEAQSDAADNLSQALEEIIDEMGGFSDADSDGASASGSAASEDSQEQDGAGDEALLVEAIDASRVEVAPLPAAPPPPPPPPIPSEDARRRRPVADGNMRAAVGMGSSHIAYYHRPKQFYAVCLHAGHDRCRLTRTSNPSARSAASGRPLGYLMSWLSQAHLYSTADEHHHQCFPSFSDRRTARLELHAIPEAASLFAMERPKGDALDSEPE